MISHLRTFILLQIFVNCQALVCLNCRSKNCIVDLVECPYGSCYYKSVDYHFDDKNDFTERGCWNQGKQKDDCLTSYGSQVNTVESRFTGYVGYYDFVL